MTNSQNVQVPSAKLNDGNVMPLLGFGTYRIQPGYTAQGAVANALSVRVSKTSPFQYGPAYRHIDTAALYKNEADVGKALMGYLADTEESNVDKLDRKDFFITTKLWNTHGRDRCLSEFEKSLKKMGDGVGYIDLYLMHSPIGGKLIETYDAMLELRQSGKLRSVGVSNFGIKHLEVIRKAGRPMPAVNQIELHPLNRKERQSLLDYCKQHNVLIVAYGSLFAGYPQYLSHESVTTAAKTAVLKNGRTDPVTPAQVLLRWAIDLGNTAVIPKSITEERIEINAQIWDFDITAEGKAGLDGMQGELGDYWDPLDEEIDAEDLEMGKEEL